MFKGKNFTRLLFARFLFINLILIVGAGAAPYFGLAQPLYVQDTTSLTYGISAVFLYGLVKSAVAAWRLSGGLDSYRSIDDACYGHDVTRNKARLGTITEVANMLVMLGLIGTIIGFSVSASMLATTDLSNLDSLAKNMSKMGEGLSIAFNTTLLGSIFYVWLRVNLRILTTGLYKLVNRGHG